MPNPGRMQEILLPGTLLGIRPGPQGGRHPWRVQTLHRNDATIPLDTGAANTIARALLDHHLIPGLEDREVLRAEVTPPGGGSRFDFELEPDGGRSSGAVFETGYPSAQTPGDAPAPTGNSPRTYLEVKSCTLFNGRWALFPDAVTDRGRRHVTELAEHPGSVVVFLVHSPQVEFFSPDIHVDPEFSHTLYAHRESVTVLPVALDWSRDMTLRSAPRLLPIPWERIRPGLQDRGSYLIVLQLPTEQTMTVGALGPRSFPAGYYVYVGSAMQHLSKRIDRHRLRRRTRKHWHVDYLREAAQYLAGYPIRDPYRREEELAEAMEMIADGSIPGFGSSDSTRPSHLFRFDRDPRTDERFQEIILTFRRAVFG
jgi:sugar fermentation stimulation protein A